MGNQAHIRHNGELSPEAAAFEAAWRAGRLFQMEQQQVGNPPASLAELDYQLTKAWRNYLRDRGTA
jgi:hypothetical protein